MKGRLSAARTAVLAANAVVLAGHVLPAATWPAPLRRAWFPALAGLGSPGHVALTFDDSPDPESTPRFLDALDALDARATFFLIGDSACRHRRLTAAIAGRGHELAVHGWTHRRPWLPSVRGELCDLRRAATAVADLTGAAPRWYRRDRATGGPRWPRCLGLSRTAGRADGRSARCGSTGHDRTPVPHPQRWHGIWARRRRRPARRPAGEGRT